MGRRITFATATTGRGLSVELAVPARATSFFPQEESVITPKAALHATRNANRDESRELHLEELEASK
jgi:hypothetical protein